MPRAAKESTPHRQRLNRDRVLAAAVALADAEGIDALSMRRLAQRLGVEAMSLYNHVAHKDDLLDGMVDRVAGEIELADESPDWRQDARRRAVSAHAVLMRHPWAARVWTSRGGFGPRRLRYLEDALRRLRAAGFDGGMLDRAFHTIENHIIGHALQAQGLSMDPEQMASAGEKILRTFPATEYPELAKHIRYHVDNPGGDDEFEFGLDLILDGLIRARAGA